MAFFSQHRSRTVPLWIVTLSILVAPLSMADTSAPLRTLQGLEGGAHLAYAESPDALLLSFREDPGELGEAAGGPAVRVYGNGRVTVHWPPYYQAAGDYEAHLDPGELDQLLRAVVSPELAAFDARHVARTKEAMQLDERLRALEKGQGIEIHHVSDPPVTHLEVHLSGYGSPSGSLLRPLDLRISWQGLRSDVERFPQIEALETILAVEERLRGLMERNDLRRIEP